MKAKHPGGRHPFKPTDAQRNMVLLGAGHFIPQEQIAASLGIDAKTLRKYFKDELARGAAVVEMNLAGSQFQRAKGKDSVAQKATEFILQTRFRWTKTESLELTGKDGGPIETMEVTDEKRARALANFIARTKKG